MNLTKHSGLHKIKDSSSKLAIKELFKQSGLKKECTVIIPLCANESNLKFNLYLLFNLSGHNKYEIKYQIIFLLKLELNLNNK